MLKIQSLNVAYGSRRVLHDLSLHVGQGEIVAVIGPNGAGKTTLLQTVSGVLHPETGEVHVAGKEVTGLPAPLRARYLAVVPQARQLPATFTVFQAVYLGRTPYLGWLGRGTPADLERIRWALERTQMLALSERRLHELSGGEQQLVLLARALAQDAPILLLDEPTAHLDMQHQSSLLNLVRELAEERGLAVLMALHDLNLVSLYANRVALLASGRLQAMGAPATVLTPGLLTAAYRVPVSVIPHPEYGTPLVIPDGGQFSPVREERRDADSSGL